METNLAALSAQLEPVIQEVLEALATYGLNVLGAFAILVAGLWFSGWAARAMRRALQRSRYLDVTLVSFFASFVKYTVVVLTVIAVLNQFGVQTTSLLAVIGAAGLAIGLALQGTLSNVAAGVMLLIFRPYRAGDFVQVGGQMGTIVELTLFFTVMASPENVRIIVPNAQIWGNTITNYSVNATRRIDIVVGISYDDDIDKAIEVVGRTLGEDSRVLAEPKYDIRVTALADFSVNLNVRFWVANADFWAVRTDVTKKIKQAFDANSVTIPFPTRTIVAKAAE